MIPNRGEQSRRMFSNYNFSGCELGSLKYKCKQNGPLVTDEKNILIKSKAIRIKKHARKKSVWNRYGKRNK